MTRHWTTNLLIIAQIYNAVRVTPLKIIIVPKHFTITHSTDSQVLGVEYDRALFVKSDDIRKARGKQSVESTESLRRPLLSHCIIISLTWIVNIFRITHKSIANSSQLYGSDGRSHTHVVTIEISESTESTFG